MSALGFMFNAATVAPAEPGLAVWEGPVLVSIVRAEIKPTAANDGSNMGILHVKAMDGQYAGQENVIRLNLWNKNAQAADIAQRQLSSICHCVNRMQVSDLAQLVGPPFVAVFEKQERDITDQATGQKRSITSCQPREFRLPDGRTVREALNGQPASNPYPGPGAAPAVAQQPPFTGQQQHPQQPPAGQPPFGAPAGAPGFPPTTQPGGFAPSTGQPAPGAGTAPGFAGAPGGFPSPQAAPGTGTAPSPASGGFAPPAGAPGGFAPPAGAMGAPAGGAPWANAPGGFGPR